jgi:hypothetical protein
MKTQVLEGPWDVSIMKNPVRRLCPQSTAAKEEGSLRPMAGEKKTIPRKQFLH